MKKNMDKIQFEHREEVQEMMRVIGKCMDTCPEEKDNGIVREFYSLLDVMDMEW